MEWTLEKCDFVLNVGVWVYEKAFVFVYKNCMVWYLLVYSNLCSTRFNECLFSFSLGAVNNKR